jgi:hypothetical protein
MAITYTWEINGTACKRDVADGYFTNVVYRVKGMDGTEEKARHTGEVTYTKPESLPSEFIAFDASKKTPDSATMITWVKNYLGTDAVTAIETDLKSAIDLINTPVQATGVAF